jgi:hypothetical protein
LKKVATKLYSEIALLPVTTAPFGSCGGKKKKRRANSINWCGKQETKIKSKYETKYERKTRGAMTLPKIKN